jgi:cardiolipin synthase
MRGWTSGNKLTLLENGEEFFPRVFDAIRVAEREIVLETFIWSEDDTGKELLRDLIDAAARGVSVRITVDGYGSPGFSKAFMAELAAAGISLESFDPRPRIWNLRTNPLCRLHRKTVIVDRRIAFVGGINFGDVHLRRFGEQSKQDYAVEAEGPVVQQIYDCCRFSPDAPKRIRARRWRYWLRRIPREMRNPTEDAQAIFVLRDNEGHPTDIEAMYRVGIRHAKQRVIIACAYFFPSYRFIRALRKAAKRGVEVCLIMQGNPDRPIAVSIGSLLYEDLIAAGATIYLYTERPLHAKVAVIDDRWSTVGSSNLDPISLGLNLEGNLFMLDKNLNQALTNSLERLIERSCEKFCANGTHTTRWWRRFLLTATYHVARKMRSWSRRRRAREQGVHSIRYRESAH